VEPLFCRHFPLPFLTLPVFLPQGYGPPPSHFESSCCCFLACFPFSPGALLDTSGGLCPDFPPFARLSLLIFFFSALSAIFFLHTLLPFFIWNSSLRSSLPLPPPSFRRRAEVSSRPPSPGLCFFSPHGQNPSWCLAFLWKLCTPPPSFLRFPSGLSFDSSELGELLVFFFFWRVFRSLFEKKSFLPSPDFFP